MAYPAWPVDGRADWATVAAFAAQTLRALGMLNSRLLAAADEVERLDALTGPLPGPGGAPRVRALPAVVIEALFARADPSSRRNPVADGAPRWCAIVLLLLLLLQGLRRSEACLLRYGCLRTEVGTDGVRRWWLRATGPTEEDPRWEKPGLKTP